MRQGVKPTIKAHTSIPDIIMYGCTGTVHTPERPGKPQGTVGTPWLATSTVRVLVGIYRPGNRDPPWGYAESPQNRHTSTVLVH